MRMRTTTMLIASAAIVFGTSGAWAGTTTLTGTVGDAMCGVKHMVKGDDAACTRACVKGGAEYALIVKGEAYTLKGNAQIKEQLHKLADQKAIVTGIQKDKTIEVASVQAAK